MVAGALSRKTSHGLAALRIPKELCRILEKMDIEIVKHEEVKSRLSFLVVRPTIFKEIMASQELNDKFAKLHEQIKEDKAEGFTILEDGFFSLKEDGVSPRVTKNLRIR